MRSVNKHYKKVLVADSGNEWKVVKTYGELPVIPKVIADMIVYAKTHKHGLYWVLRRSPSQLVKSDIISQSKIREYTNFFRQGDGQDVLARAWLDGYQVEEDE